MFTRSAGFLLTENLYICAIKHTSNHNMKKFNLIAVLTILSVSYLSAQSSILESQSMPSKLMKKDIRYSVYLPDGYHTSGQKYPVLYLLHGYTDDETGWTQFGNVRRIADEAIATGKSAEMIIVMPDAWDTWYLNSFDNQEPYENMFFEELIPFIESTYRARATREHRAIAGAEDKSAFEQRVLDVVESEQIELVVLARYMQILSPELCEALAGKAINIHHSFLPGFKGANPYRQAHGRGSGRE